MSVAEIKNSNHYTYVQRLIGSSFERNKAPNNPNDFLPYNVSDTYTKSQPYQSLTYSRNGLKGNGGRGSGEAMMSAEEREAWLKANPPKPIPYSEEWYAEKRAAGIEAMNARNADFQHHDDPTLKFSDYVFGRMGTLYQDTILGKAPKLEDIPSYTKRSEYTLKAVLEHEGITLNDDEKFYITVKDGKKIVSGLEDKEKQKRIEEAINTTHIIGKDYMAGVFGLETLNFINTDWAKEGVDFVDSQIRASLTKGKSGYQQELKDLLGIDIDLSKIYLDENGAISGYPPELEQILGSGWNPNTQVDGINLSQQAMQVHHILELIGRYGYDNIPDMDESDIYLSYSNKGGLEVLN